MNIQGLQKMTLLDYPGRVACTVFLGGCDLRCPFCHNFELVIGQQPTVVTEEEFFAFLGKRHGLLDGVAITGGEPCLRSDLPDFLEKIREAGFPVKLDTNGTHPQMLREVIDRGLVSYVAMDVKNSPAKYAQTVGLPHIDLEPIRQSVELLKSSGVDYEFRTTVVEQFHDAESFRDIAAWIAGAPRYYLQPFTSRDTVPDQSLCAPSPEKLREYRDICAPHVALAEIRGFDESDPA